MPIHSSVRLALSRPRPKGPHASPGGSESTGEGGNMSSRLAAVIGPNGLLAAALLLSAALVGLVTALVGIAVVAFT
ncbi:hypothetical protein B0I29_117189 [Actinoplanes lutulentus]|uniref:Uncharacterized protein n=1 Tax=Actinoplanes lutulentus TaxID=1287878 RepID=A0A327Z3R7_9ACTN|nr:hypothetical protein B0I29_117189 [Actinoplanes lutulentus]